MATAALALVIAPWALWNQTRFHDSVPLSTNDGTTLLGANCPATYDSNIVGGWSLACVLKTKIPRDASVASARQSKIGIDYAKAHLGRLPIVLVAREGRTFGFWRPDQSVYINTGEGRPEWASWTAFAVFWALIPVAVVGAVGLRRRRITDHPGAGVPGDGDRGVRAVLRHPPVPAPGRRGHVPAGGRGRRRPVHPPRGGTANAERA